MVLLIVFCFWSDDDGLFLVCWCSGFWGFVGFGVSGDFCLGVYVEIVYYFELVC